MSSKEHMAGRGPEVTDSLQGQFSGQGVWGQVMLPDPYTWAIGQN